jgi:protein arginine kinase
MGVDLEFFPATTRAVVDELFILSQPAHVQKAAERKLTAEERDIYRADLVRERLKNVSKPKAEDGGPSGRGPTALA